MEKRNPKEDMIIRSVCSLRGFIADDITVEVVALSPYPLMLIALARSTVGSYWVYRNGQYLAAYNGRILKSQRTRHGNFHL